MKAANKAAFTRLLKPGWTSRRAIRAGARGPPAR